ncbi:pyridoxal-phosphate dependent enzyme [Thermoactinomyces sp. DSM 45892]|uniref:pyridoxal-phosphate dependent enzyme n=1 Tax=Thermoactinomyces sp. DSM 45892 TaxID=1882753 RepID=UPI000895695B|nr:pyridoxal-phosphate dependent enzyme [Thermoactinomyces sp. DSM 45892]SDZ33462.1 cysteine synthase A [Thermoactinomyces sp. DSM 45892]
MDMKFRHTLLKSPYEELIHPHLYRVRDNLFLVQFKVMKVLPALNIVRRAMDRGEINQDSLVVDTSSGTFALGLALVCHHFKLKLKIVSDPALDKNLKTRLEDLGAHVVVVIEPDEQGNYQSKRLQVVKQIVEENKNAFWCNQYDNTDNMQSYGLIADLIAEKIGAQVSLVGAVGSGGSTSGIMQALRDRDSDSKMVAVDTFGSVLFGLTDSKRELRGLGNSVIPKNLKHDLYDEVHWVSARLAYSWTRNLHRKHAIYAGGTTGACYGVADFLSRNSPDETFVFIGPDDGVRYMETIYNDDWLRENQLILPNHELTEPQGCIGPWDVCGSSYDWAFMKWNRKSAL